MRPFLVRRLSPLSRKSTVEHSFLAYLRGRCRKLPQVPVGIGDDAAVLEPVSGQQIACVDQIIDGVDFISDRHSLTDVGYKSVAINLSDMAAIGGAPSTLSHFHTKHELHRLRGRYTMAYLKRSRSIYRSRQGHFNL